MTLESKLQALVTKWREQERQIKRMYAHPQDYSDTKQEGRGEAICDCADDIEALLAERQEPPWNGPEICPKCGTSIYNCVIQCPKPDCGHIFAATAEGKK